MTGLDLDLEPVLGITDITDIAVPADINDEAYSAAEDIERLPVSMVPVSSLQLGFFLRGTGTDPVHVKILADAADPASLPPILVQRSNFSVIDGMHRLEAAKLRGETTVKARLIDCSDREAFILAVKSNTSHGLPLARTDRIAGAKRILAWHPDWSDRAIGVATGLSAKTIAGIRRRSGDSVQQFAKRLGRDGKRRPLNAEGRRRAAAYLTACPDATLREVAKEADVSLGTVHDVRAQMRRGLDPLTSGRGQEAAERKLGIPGTPSGRAGRGAAANTPSLTGAGRVSPSATWSMMSSKLANDPSLKYTEGGRNFIRWMASHIPGGEEWREFIDAVPPHWASDVSVIAEKASFEWRAFAEQLKQRRDQAV